MTRFLPLVIMVIAALGAGIVMVPSAWEIASMKLRDKDFTAAERTFEDKYLAGDRSREVLLPLAELYVRDGRVDKAIAVLAAYSKANPGERDVMERAATLLREAQHADRATQALELLAKDTASPEALRELERRHDISQDADGRVRALTRLVETNAATPKEITTLTNLLAANGQKEKATNIAYAAIKREPGKIPAELVQIFAALAVDNGRRDLIDGAVIPWGKVQKTAGPLNAVVSALLDKGDTKSALSLVRDSTLFANRAPDAVVLMARLEADHGDKKRAFELLDELRKTRKLPPSQDASYIALALGQTQTDVALDHVMARGYQNLEDATLLYAIGSAAIHGKTDWLKKLDAALAGSPRALPAARTALALGEMDRAVTLAKSAEAAGATVALAQLYAEMNELESAARVLDAAVDDAASVSAPDLPPALAAAIALKRGPLALALADRLVQQDKSTDAAIQRARAVTLNGRPEEALEILAALNSTSDQADLAESEALFAAKRFAELRGKLIAKLTTPGLPPVRRTNVIFMLNDLKIALGPEAAVLSDGLTAELDDAAIAGPSRDARVSLLSKISPAKALPYLKDDAEADPGKYGYAYVKLLKDLKRSTELKTFLLAAASNAKTAKTRDDFLFELLKQGGAREALPLLAARAKTDGQKWFFAYDEALKAYGSRADRLAALQAFAEQSGTPPEMRSQIAFQILELGDKPRAEAMFRAVSEDSGPASPEVRQLAYLWGPRPSPAQLAWLKARATDAPAQDRAAWAAMLINAGDAKSAEQVLTATPGPKAVAALAGIYAETRNVKALRTLIKSELDGADAQTAKALAEAADAVGLPVDAARAYDRAGMAGPAGRAAFFAGDHDRAVAFLEKAQGAAENAFYLAEALTALNRPRDAEPHYRAALSKLGKSSEARKMRIVALARLKDHAGAERELAETPDDDAEKSDSRDAYAGALLDQGDTDRAAAQLGL